MNSTRRSVATGKRGKRKEPKEEFGLDDADTLPS